MEYYSKCNICGKISCYTEEDLKDNNKQSLIAGLAALSAIGNSLVGTKYDMYENTKLSNRASNKIVDYSKCPNCGSKDVILVTKKFAIFSNKVNGNYSVDDLIREANNYIEKKDFENAFCFATIALTIDDNNYNAYLIRFLASYEINNLNELRIIKEDYYNNPHFKNLLNHSNSEQKECLLKIYKKNNTNNILLNAKVILKSQNHEKLIEKIDSIIEEIKQNNIKEEQLINELQEKKLEIIYSIACKYLEENTIKSVNKSIELFTITEKYKDSLKKLEICNSTLKTIKNKTKKKRFIMIGIVLICIISIVVFKNIKESIILANVEKDINEKKYEQAYNSLINIKDSEKKNNYLNEIRKHGRYVIKNVKGTSEDTSINYEYDEKGNPRKIIKEFNYEDRTKFKYEYVFDYSYIGNDVSKMTIISNQYVRDMDKVYMSHKNEYSFYNDNYDYEFTLDTSVDNPEKYSGRSDSILLLIEYIYLKNVESINCIYNPNDPEKNRIIKVTKDGLIQNSELIHYNLNNIEKKYKNGLIINKTINNKNKEIYEYEYDLNNNFVKIKMQKNGLPEDNRDFQWEWINY